VYWPNYGPNALAFEMCARVIRREMTSWQRWVQRPQSLWIRKAFFQVHLWVGLVIGLYVAAISISGSAIVFRRELTRKHSRQIVILAQSRHRMSVEELTQHAQQAYPSYEVDNLSEQPTPNGPADVVLERAHKRIERLFDPYTGSDLGDRHSAIERGVTWLADLHDNLLAGSSGRLGNGIGSCLVTLLALTGAMLWWPGIRNWRRSTTINWQARFPRFNWDVHSAIGFWCWFFVLVWGISGIYFCFPAISLSPGIHLIAGSFLAWLAQLHFGRFNWFTEALWTMLGLVPAVSALTGALMWWNRVLRKKFRRPHRLLEHAAFETRRGDPLCRPIARQAGKW
jgi:uncharacterized iron-regulated membrane protein